MIETTTTSALAELERIEGEALAIDLERGAVAQEEEAAIAESHAARAELEAYWTDVGAGAEPDERRLKALTARANRLKSSIVARTESGRPRQRSLPHEARAQQIEGRYWGKRREAELYAAEHRGELEGELVSEALRVHADLMAAYDALVVATRAHRAVGDRFAHISVLAGGRAPTDLATPAALPSDIRGQAEAVAPPIPDRAITEAVVAELHERQPQVAGRLEAVLEQRAERERFAEANAERQARKEREAGEHEAKLAARRARRVDRKGEPDPAA